MSFPEFQIFSTIDTFFLKFTFEAMYFKKDKLMKKLTPRDENRKFYKKFFKEIEILKNLAIFLVKTP